MFRNGIHNHSSPAKPSKHVRSHSHKPFWAINRSHGKETVVFLFRACQVAGSEQSSRV